MGCWGSGFKFYQRLEGQAGSGYIWRRSHHGEATVILIFRTQFEAWELLQEEIQSIAAVLDGEDTFKGVWKFTEIY